MDWIKDLLDVVLHLDERLHELLTNYGAWTYLILFLIVFCETGLVITPFLPGDSLLFAAGALAGRGSLDVRIVMGIFVAAALTGDNVNYWIGRSVGPRIFHKESSRWLNRRHLDRTHEFFEKYGGKTIIIARYVPIIRTFTPFVAGVGSMPYLRFLSFSVAGALLWVITMVLAGYWFGGLELVRKNFSLVVLAIIVVSLIPAVVEYLRHRRMTAKTNSSSDAVP